MIDGQGQHDECHGSRKRIDPAMGRDVLVLPRETLEQSVRWQQLLGIHQ